MQVISFSKDARLHLVKDFGAISEELDDMCHKTFNSKFEFYIDHKIPYGSHTPTHKLVRDKTDIGSLHTALRRCDIP